MKKIEEVLSYDEFLKSYPRYKKFKENKTAEKIYSIISSKENIYSMIQESIADRPALGACVQIIEERFGNNTEFELHNDFVKQCIGTFCRGVLNKFGFKPVKQKIVSTSSFFKTAAVYKQLEKPILRIKVEYQIEKI